VDLRRNVAVVRLRSAELVILSSGPFTREDIAAINGAGKPRWLVDAMLRHDTFANEGRAAFPDVAYLAPPGFGQRVPFPVQPILPAPSEWGNELLTLELHGVPSMRETVFFHAASRTLIVQDLAFNFHDHQPLWTELVLRAAVGKAHTPGISRSFKLTMRDRGAFQRSLDEMLAWDFDRVIVGHGERIESEGKKKLSAALERAGFQARRS
jgi:hypothetical protein